MEPICKPRTRSATKDSCTELWFLQFPQEIIFHIISFLEPKYLLDSATICKNWSLFLKEQESYLWKELCFSEWPHLKSSLMLALENRGTINFKHFYISRRIWMDKISGMKMSLTDTLWKSVSDPLELTVELPLRVDGSSIRSNIPWISFTTFPANSKKDHNVHYYEVEIIDGGKEQLLGVGLGDKATPALTIPGWNRGGTTVGYHADNGLKYFKMGHGHTYNTPYGTGDTIGCGYDVNTNSVFFTKNGVYLGVAFSDFPSVPLYPMCGALEQCKAKFNFGSCPFKFDVDRFYLQKGHQLLEEAQATKIRASPFRIRNNPFGLM